MRVNLSAESTTLKQLGQAVKEVGQELIQLRQRGITNGEWQGTQFKAEADRIAHEILSEKLSKIDSSIPIVSEEDPKSLSKFPTQYFIIDPIDGTASFAGGFKGYVCQAAYVSNGKVELAAVFAPELNLLYLAQAQAGASCNGQALRLHRNTSRRALIDNYPEPRGLADTAFKRLECTSYVESGSIGLKICRIADGTADLFLKNMNARDWDLAAPMLILEEAGGFISDLQGNSIVLGRESRAHQGLIATADSELQTRCVQFAKEI